MTDNASTKDTNPQVQPILSLMHPDGTIVETILRSEESRLLVWRDGDMQEQGSLVKGDTRYVPYSGRNNLLSRKVIRLASGTMAYGNRSQLVQDVRNFIHRYVDISADFEEVAAHYVVLTWVYDAFAALPYLRVRGDYGSGKSRFLLTVGSVCYKPIFASGASTVSPLFRLMDEIGGTLVVDEADFRFSDERAEIVKILNNGNARGFPVLRSDVTPSKEFNPRAFDIFGPKIIATRHAFEDLALESRCLTEDLGAKALRADVPISLPRAFEREAQELRNKLLQYRFDSLAPMSATNLDADDFLSPRKAQILAPLLRVADDEEAQYRILAFARVTEHTRPSGQIEAERRMLISLKRLMVSAPNTLHFSLIAKQFNEDWRADYGIDMTPRWIGSVVRSLGFQPRKTNGVFAIPSTEYPQLTKLIQSRVGDIGDDRDTATT